MKPILDKMTDMVVGSLSGEARQFYDREFGFFNEVTSISGKLKPYIKKTKPEKKVGVCIALLGCDTDHIPRRKSTRRWPRSLLKSEYTFQAIPTVKLLISTRSRGGPSKVTPKYDFPYFCLYSVSQVSIVQAPFMATFKVRKERVVEPASSDNILEGDGQGKEEIEEYDIWQQAIFKVGDDCRQDVLALQVIAMFKNIFTSVGLTLYVFPYRVTATAPGVSLIMVWGSDQR